MSGKYRKWLTEIDADDIDVNSGKIYFEKDEVMSLLDDIESDLSSAKDEVNKVLNNLG